MTTGEKVQNGECVHRPSVVASQPSCEGRAELIEGTSLTSLVLLLKKIRVELSFLGDKN